MILKKFTPAFCPSVASFFMLRVMSCSLCQGAERGLAIITPRVALTQISQGDRVGRESNRKCERQKGIKRETKRPKRKERIGKGSSKSVRMESVEMGREVKGGEEEWERERLRDTMLENSLWSLSRGTRGDGIPRRTLLKFNQPRQSTRLLYKKCPAQLRSLSVCSLSQTLSARTRTPKTNRSARAAPRSRGSPSCHWKTKEDARGCKGHKCFWT